MSAPILFPTPSEPLEQGAPSPVPPRHPLLTPSVEALLDRYLTLLLEANERVNLTGARTLSELRTRHLDDCLELLALPEVTGATRLLDVGTGGGLPGIPLACALPSASLVLMDSTQKKLTQVEGMIASLGLSNARTLCGRAEDLAHQRAWRGTQDCVVSRALAPLPSLLEYLAGFVRPGGFIVAQKGSDAHQELKRAQDAMQQLRLALVRVHDYQVRDLSFSLLVFRAIERLPERFPRQQGLVRSRPLGEKPETANQTKK